MADLVITVAGGARPDISASSKSDARVPWAGHTTALRHARDLRGDQGATSTTLVFVNTRMQAEFAVPGAVASQRRQPADRAASRLARRRRSGARSRRRWRSGRLRAVVCTSTLDLGIDWGDVDLVIHVGAPKGASRLVQRIGRSNHRMDEPSQAHPGAVQPLRGAGMPRRARGGRGRRAGHARAARRGALDVLAQHVLGVACADAVRRRRAL